LETVQKIKNVLRKKMKDISDVSVQLLPFISVDDQGYRTRYRSENAKRK